MAPRKYCAHCWEVRLTGKQTRWCSVACKRKGNLLAWQARWQKRRRAEAAAA